MNEYLKVAIQAAEASGEQLTNYFEKIHDFSQKNKNKRDLVTEVDIISERIIVEVIEKSFPDHSINGEELGKKNRDSDYTWHVDPIDGTVNYSQGIPLCAVSIALEFSNKIIAGVIYNPFTEELYFASEGNGAFLNGHPIHVSEKTDMAEGLFIIGLSSDSSVNQQQQYDTLMQVNNATRGVLRLGSAAIALAYVASGKLDGFWAKGLFSWDLAAGIILIEEAGGKVTSDTGDNYSFGSDIVATNSGLHSSLLTFF